MFYSVRRSDKCVNHTLLSNILPQLGNKNWLSCDHDGQPQVTFWFAMLYKLVSWSELLCLTMAG